MENEKKQNEAVTLSFEEAMSRLQEIAELLENGRASLDTSPALYEEGITLVRLCNEKLTEAEAKIRVLDPKTDGASD